MDTYINMKNFIKAKQFIRKINISQLPSKDKAVIYNKFGFIYYKLKNYNLSLTNYLLSLRYNDKLPYVYNNIGILYFTMGNYINAKEYYLKALKLNSKYTKVLVNLAVVDFYLRNYSDAYKWYKQAKKIDKNYIKKRFNKKKGIKKLRELANKYPNDKELQDLLKWAEKNYNSDRLFN